MADQPFIKDIDGAIVKAIDDATARAINEYAFTKGREVGVREGRQTLSRGWFFAVAVALMLFGFVAGFATGQIVNWVEFEQEKFKNEQK